MTEPIYNLRIKGYRNITAIEVNREHMSLALGERNKNRFVERNDLRSACFIVVDENCEFVVYFIINTRYQLLLML